MKKSIVFLAFILTLAACKTVHITGRKQLNFIPNSQLFPASFAQYDQFLKEHPPSKDVQKQERIRRIGNRIVKAVETYYKSRGWEDELKGYQWEFNVVDDSTMNAFAMPGGKVVYFDGLLKVTTTDDEIAAVMGHEIAHALANHGAERMSQVYMQNLGAILTMLATQNAPPEEREKWLAIYGYGSTLGVILPYSRKHESEADKIGQILMAIAGYNPDAAVNVWIKMTKLGGQQPPEFLSTHPSHERRIENLKKWAPEAKKIARQYGVVFDDENEEEGKK
ncbi:MAG: M48 family metallopeptidase [Chlorobi bacterium]|nr:M48 family metallopeptidase [Chlorobiota bacterium]